MSLQGKQQLEARFKAIGNTQALLKDVQIHAVQYAKLTVPRKTANLGRTIRVGSATVRSASIYAGGTSKVGYAAYVEFGTKPHVIRPKPGRVGKNGRPAALAWGGSRRLTGTLRSGSKATHFARLVHHPGTKPKPFLGPAMTKAALGIPGTIVVRWNDAA